MQKKKEQKMKEIKEESEEAKKKETTKIKMLLLQKQKKSKRKREKKKETHEVEMIKIGVEVTATIYQRFSKDQKITFNTSTKDFIEHLETPESGSLTGGQLPYTPMTTLRGHRRGLMNRVLACGPSKDLVLHRSLITTKTNLPMTNSFTLDISILLSIPVAPQMSAQDREILQLLQIIARHHHSGYANEFEYIVDEMTRLAEILEVRPDSTLRIMILTAIMSKKNLSQRSQKILFNTLNNEIEIDRVSVF
uniref:NR LBD domain-containing protein n=1 Tax=Panagrolaimus superbus TaxID=310955 RepID=A0A914YWA9_9BILA